MRCHSEDCTNGARIQETRAPHRQFCGKLCQARYWLGVTPRLSREEAGQRCRLRLGQTDLEARVSVALLLDEPDRALLGDLDEKLGLVRGTLCCPRLRLAYQFNGAQYDFLHWLDFVPPLYADEGNENVLVAWRLGNTQVMVSHDMLVRAAMLLSRKPDRQRLESAFRVLAHANRSEDYSQAAVWNADTEQFQYRSGRDVLCHLMYFHAHEEAKQLADVVAALLRRGRRPLRITSVQDYVAHALQPLGDLGRPHETSTRPGQQLIFALPGLHEPGWEERVSDYVLRQDHTPRSNMLQYADHVTIVAREPGPEGRLLGYVTCSLQEPVENEPSAQALGADAWHSPVMRQFVGARNTGGVWDMLVIEGLSVDRGWRGGRQDSVAVLLVFHALYFALRCAADCGLKRVSCQSAVRTTAIIMRQFGGVHTNARAAVEWMEERLKLGQSCADDLAAFAAEYEDSAALMVGSESEQVANLKAQLSLDKSKLTALGARWMAPMDALAHSIDTVLCLGGENRQLHNEMARLERLLTEQAEKQPRLPEEGDPQGDARRKRVRATGASLTVMAIGALSKFALL